MSNIPTNNLPDPAEGPDPGGEPDPGGGDVQVDVSIRHRSFEGDTRAIARAVQAALASRGIHAARIEVAIVDDPTIHELNRQHLDHDWPTDVISFPYGRTDGAVEGELVASWDTAVRAAAEFGWDAATELLLYVIHGTLHVTGMDDQTPEGRREMRRSEAAALRRLGIAEADRYAASGDDGGDRSC